LRGETGPVGQEFTRDPPPGKLVALDVRDLVVPALFVHALPQAQKVNLPAADLRLALQNGAAFTSTCAQTAARGDAAFTHPRFS
jgi:hypothetical protein